MAETPETVASVPVSRAPTPLQNAIRAALLRTGRNARAVSLAAGLSDSAIKNILQGKSSSPRVDTVRALARELGEPLEAFVGLPAPRQEGAPPIFAPGSDVQPLLTREPMEARRLPLGAQAPVMGTVSCGEDGQFEVNLTDGPIEYVDLPPKLVGVPDIIALFVAGESMAGVWSPGDTVFISKRRPVTQGSYAVVLVEAEKGRPPSAYLKEYVRGDNEKVVLRQANPTMERDIPRYLIREMWRALHWREWAL